MSHDPTIPALSLRQPWLWCIFECGKRIENRVWFRRFRGEFLLHAAKSMTREELESAYSFARHHVGTVPGKWQLDPPTKAELQFGGIVGRARIESNPMSPHGPPRDPWHISGQYGYPLTAVERLVDAEGRPACIPWRGHLGFFDVERADLERVMQTERIQFRAVTGNDN